jgi:hypothetical protein
VSRKARLRNRGEIRDAAGSLTIHRQNAIPGVLSGEKGPGLVKEVIFRIVAD